MIDFLTWILAGGKSRRMGVDKALVTIGDKPMIEHVLDRAKEVSAPIIINSNGDTSLFAHYGHGIMSDDAAFRDLGPLGGIATGIAHLKSQGTHDWLLVLPTDTPILPENLIPKLLAEADRSQEKIILADMGGRLQHVLGLWHVDLLHPLVGYLTENARVLPFVEASGYRAVRFEDGVVGEGVNINTPEERTAVEARLKT